MPPITPKPFSATAATSSGITIALIATRNAQYIRIGLSAAAQVSHFGGPLNPDTDAVAIEMNTDAGKNHIMTISLSSSAEPNGLQLSGGTRGSVSVKLQPWCAIPKGKLPAKSMPVIGGKSPSHVMTKLPDWARPEPIKAGQGKSLMGD